MTILENPPTWPWRVQQVPPKHPPGLATPASRISRIMSTESNQLKYPAILMRIKMKKNIRGRKRKIRKENTP